jgi:hypothetical protein
VDLELDEEMRFHVEMEIEDRIRARGAAARSRRHLRRRVLHGRAPDPPALRSE